MNRKLHNTASALVASAGLLVLTLIAASPTPAPSPAIYAAQLESLAPAGVTALVLAETLVEGSLVDGAASETPKRKRTPRRSRQSVAMPFFSFAPRG